MISYSLLPYITHRLRAFMWRSIQHSNTTPLLSFLFFCNFTTGPMGSNMFCRISQNCEQIFRLNFCTDRRDILLCFERKKGEIFVKIWHFGPLEVLWASASSTSTTPTTPSVFMWNSLMTLKYRQDHRHSYHMKADVWFLISNFSLFGRILYNFRDIGLKRVKWPSNIIQGHQKWHQSKVSVWFPISSL